MARKTSRGTCRKIGEPSSKAKYECLAIVKSTVRGWGDSKRRIENMLQLIQESVWQMMRRESGERRRSWRQRKGRWGGKPRTKYVSSPPIPTHLQGVVVNTVDSSEKDWGSVRVRIRLKGSCGDRMIWPIYMSVSLFLLKDENDLLSWVTAQ
jgi:hypothetical protein